MFIRQRATMQLICRVTDKNGSGFRVLTFLVANLSGGNREFCIFQDGQGQTALHVACQNGHRSVCIMYIYIIPMFTNGFFLLA